MFYFELLPLRTAELTEADVGLARELALQVHACQMYGEVPYIVHLDHVHALAVEYGLGFEYRVAAYCHDMPEDHGVIWEYLAGRFGKRVADLVWAVSGFGENRKARSACIRQKLASDSSAVVLKLIDRLANCLAAKATGNLKLLRMYQQELPDYSLLFMRAHPEAYARLCLALE